MSFFTLKIALRAPGYATWHVGQGQLLCPYLGPTRTEADLAAHIEQVIDTDWHVGQGQLLCPYLGPTRTEADLAAHIEQVIDTDPDACWCFIVDQLNTHKSETLVRLVAKRENLDLALGEKGKSGILQSMASRMAFLSAPQRRIRFIYIPKHTSWLNQIECWFSILVRRLLKRGNFTSTMALQQQIEAFIEYFNRLKPCRHLNPYRHQFPGRCQQGCDRGLDADRIIFRCIFRSGLLTVASWGLIH